MDCKNCKSEMGRFSYSVPDHIDLDGGNVPSVLRTSYICTKCGLGFHYDPENNKIFEENVEIQESKGGLCPKLDVSDLHLSIDLDDDDDSYAAKMADLY
jgi:DNA-directed RNA polymerase subunit RPC12/RpoP